MTTAKNLLEYLKEENIEFEYIGDEGISINGFSSLAKYKSGTMTWVKENNSTTDKQDLDKICLAIIQKDVEFDQRINQIRTKESKRAFFLCIEKFFDHSSQRSQVGVGTYMSQSVQIGLNVMIGHNCTLDGDISIGDNTIIGDNVTILNAVKIGADCVIQPGVRIGANGYGYTEDALKRKKMVKHFGGVVIGDDVLIGCNTTIYRGTIDDTEIGAGCKIDGLCHIAHNVQLGNNVSLVAGTILYGSVKVEDNAYLATSIIKNQRTIGDSAFIGMGSVVIRNVEDETVVVGNPARVLYSKGNNG